MKEKRGFAAWIEGHYFVGGVIVLGALVLILNVFFVALFLNDRAQREQIIAPEMAETIIAPQPTRAATSTLELPSIGDLTVAAPARATSRVHPLPSPTRSPAQSGVGTLTPAPKNSPGRIGIHPTFEPTTMPCETCHKGLRGP